MELKIGGLKELEADVEKLAMRVLIPFNAYSFDDLNTLKQDEQLLDVCLSSVGVTDKDGIERVTVYKFLATIASINRDRAGTRVALQMKKDPDITVIEL